MLRNKALLLAGVVVLSLACLATPTPEPVASKAPQVEPEQPIASEPAAAQVQTPLNSAQIDKFARGWYGPACDEPENAPYRWEITLLYDASSGRLEGVVKFHNCPGGGWVTYRVSGLPSSDQVVTLAGKKVAGGGDLHATAKDEETFTFDVSTVQLSPQLVK